MVEEGYKNDNKIFQQSGKIQNMGTGKFGVCLGIEYIFSSRIKNYEIARSLRNSTKASQ